MLSTTSYTGLVGYMIVPLARAPIVIQSAVTCKSEGTYVAHSVQETRNIIDKRHLQLQVAVVEHYVVVVCNERYCRSPTSLSTRVLPNTPGACPVSSTRT